MATSDQGDGKDKYLTSDARQAGLVKVCWLFFTSHMLGTKLTHSAIVFVCAGILGYVTGIWSGGLFHRENVVTFETPREPTVKGIQDVVVTFAHAPPSDETVQVWIKEGDHKWYKCLDVRPLSVAASSWEATCRFGKPDSLNPNDWAKHGTKFPVAAFTWKTELPDNAGILQEIWEALKIKAPPHDVKYMGH